MQHDAGDGVHAHDVGARGARPNAVDELALPHGRLLVDEGERHEFGDAAGLLLHVTHEVEVQGALTVGLHVAEHDGRGGRYADPVRGGDDLAPLLNRDAAGGDAIAHGLDEDFSRRPGQAPDPGVLQPFEVLAHRAARAHRAVQHLLRREPVDVHTGQCRLDLPRQVDVERALHLGRQPGLHADLRCAQIRRLLGAADDLVQR